MLTILTTLSIAALPTVSASAAEGVIDGANGDRFGYQIESGDLNGDGATDVVVAAPHPSGGNAVYVFFGPLDLTANLALSGADADVVVQGPGGSETGWSIAVGDLLDGPEDDLVVTSPAESGSNGRVHVFAGPLSSGNTLPTASATVSITGHENGYSGWSVTAGDFDGDGRDELAVGACLVGTNGTGAGAAYLLDLDTASAPTSTANATSKFDGSGLTGCSMANAGDFNGDGLEDLLIGSYGDLANSGVEFGGMVSLVYGRASFDPSYDLKNGDPIDMDIANLLSESGGGNFGYDVAPLGDVNGDGYADIIIGAPAIQCDNCLFVPEDIGRAYVVLGTPDVAPGGGQGRGLHGTSRSFAVADLIYEGVSNDWTGMSVDGAGYVGDDYSKVNHPMITTPWLTGAVSLIGTNDDFAYAVAWYDEYLLGELVKYECDWDPDLEQFACEMDDSGRPQPRALRVNLANKGAGGHRFVGFPDERMGMEVHGPGDLDGDGVGDLIFGAPDQLTFDDAAGDGAVFLFAGR